MAADGALRPIEMASLPLCTALPPDVPISYAEVRFGLQPGDLLVLYSDGLMDTVIKSGNFYEEARSEKAICRCAGQDAYIWWTRYLRTFRA